MKKKIIASISMLMTLMSIYAQDTSKKVYTTDIDNFWIAFDSIQTTSDSARQIAFIKKFYIDPGSARLKSFMMVRG